LQPNQRGTAVEIEDYIREFDCLHSLMELRPWVTAQHPQAARLLHLNFTSLVDGQEGAKKAKTG
jgi:hypothetical protein